MSATKEEQTTDRPDTGQGSISNKQMKAILEEYTNKKLVEPERMSRLTKSRKTSRRENPEQTSRDRSFGEYK